MPSTSAAATSPNPRRHSSTSASATRRPRQRSATPRNSPQPESTNQSTSGDSTGASPTLASAAPPTAATSTSRARTSAPSESEPATRAREAERRSPSSASSASSSANSDSRPNAPKSEGPRPRISSRVVARPSRRDSTSAASLTALPARGVTGFAGEAVPLVVHAAMIPFTPRDLPPAHGRARAGARGAQALVATPARDTKATALDHHQPRRPRLPGGCAALRGPARVGAHVAGARGPGDAHRARLGLGEPRPPRLARLALLLLQLVRADLQLTRASGSAPAAAELGCGRLVDHGRAPAAREECGTPGPGRGRGRDVARAGGGSLPGARAAARGGWTDRAAAGAAALRVPGARLRGSRWGSWPRASRPAPITTSRRSRRLQSPSRRVPGSSLRAAGSSCSGSRSCPSW